MPTAFGLLVEKKEDLTLEEFALRCARAFGALAYATRDESWDAPIPDTLKVDTHHRDALDELSKQLLELRSMTDAEVEREVELRAWYDKQQYDKILAEYEEKMSRYQRMLGKVREWEAPAQLVDLKSFMLEQIEKSLPTHPRERRLYAQIFDDPKQALVGLDHAAYRRKRIESVLLDMEYHEPKWRAVLDTYKEREAWLRALVASVRGK